MLRTVEFNIGVNGPSNHAESKSEIIARAELIHQPSDARNLFSDRRFMAGHHRLWTWSQIARTSNCTGKTAMPILVVLIRYVMRIDADFPRAFRALLP